MPDSDPSTTLAEADASPRARDRMPHPGRAPDFSFCEGRR